MSESFCPSLDAEEVEGLIADWERAGREVKLVGRRTRARLVQLRDVRPEEVRWVWWGRVPLGKLTILDGDPGLGKSTIALDLAARISRGDPMPGESAGELAGPAGAVLLTAEDGLADTVRPRLDAAGADTERIVALPMVADNRGERLPTIADVEAIEEAVENVDARLVVIDPLAAYLGDGVNAHRDHDVRSALAGLAELADRLAFAVLLIRHLNKTPGGNPLYRGGGSIGLIAAARSGLLVAPDPGDETAYRRILASTKSNLSAPPQSVAFHLERVGETVRVAWDGETAHRAAELLAAADPDERSAREEARVFLREELATGRQLAEDLKRKASRMGIAERTLKRAKRDLGVNAEREGFSTDGMWYWRLPLGGDGSKGANSQNLAPFGGRGGREPLQDAGSTKEGQGGAKVGPLWREPVRTRVPRVSGPQRGPTLSIWPPMEPRTLLRTSSWAPTPPPSSAASSTCARIATAEWVRTMSCARRASTRPTSGSGCRRRPPDGSVAAP